MELWPDVSDPEFQIKFLIFFIAKSAQSQDCLIMTTLCLVFAVSLQVFAKGQIISKCIFGAIVSTKKPTKFL